MRTACRPLERRFAALAAGLLLANLAGQQAGSASPSRPSAVRLLAAGAYSAYALTSGGQVWAWGDGLEGQLGTGSDYTASTVPVRVLGLSYARALAATDNSAYALQGQRVWAWGDDGQGQGGNGEATYAEERPTAVGHLGPVSAVAGGGFSGYALGAGGRVWAWGDNSSGQLGLALSVPGSDSPVMVGRLEAVRQVAAGTSTAYALARDGTVWAWGDNAFSELGRSSVLPASPTPLRVPGLKGVVAIAAGGFSAFALLRDGTVWAWGDNSFGELGPDACDEAHELIGAHRAEGRLEKAPRKPPALRALPKAQPSASHAHLAGCLPARVPGLSRVTAIAAGGEAAYALGRGGSVWAWGANSYGQLGDGTTTSSARPVRVRGLAHAVAIAAGGASAYALLANGSVWAWGANSYGQLGDGTTTSSSVPVRVAIPPAPARVAK